MQMPSPEYWAEIIASLTALILLLFKEVRRAISVLAVWATSKMRSRSSMILALQRESIDRLEVMGSQLSVVAGISRMLSDNIDNVGIFECDAEGKNRHVNHAYSKFMRCNPSDLLEFGFLTFTHPDERAEVRVEWLACLAEHREYRRRVRMGNPNIGQYMVYMVQCRPIPNAPPAVAWAGSLRPVEDSCSEL